MSTKKTLSLVLAAAVIASLLFSACNKQKKEGDQIFVGIPKNNNAWFSSYEKKLLQFGDEFKVSASYQAPSSSDEAVQARVVQDAVSQGANAVLVVPNDAASLVPVFERARSQKVVVITHESPDQINADYDVEMIDNDTYGEKFIDELVKAIGTSGEYALYVGSLTVPAQTIWAQTSVDYAAAKYPGLTLIAERFPVAEDRNLSRQKTLELLQAYPNLKGFICYGSEGAPGAAQAIREKSLHGQIGVIGTTTPNAAKEFIKDGSMSSAVIWDSGDASYAMAYLAKMILDGKSSDIKDGIEIPNIGTPKFRGMNVIFDKPLILTKDNIDNYNF
ncbi:MAG: autoinducer 2 ABC transporter substrate-binding protein [Termitinemataceae bacterium]|nr:MAG: autoinducer 2 ABC transporter substrate-binding protein [Termitinemataceae bacterium]